MAHDEIEIERTPAREKVVPVRFHDAEWEYLRELAESCGLPTSTYLREIALGYQPKERPSQVEEAAVYHLAKIGANLNQLQAKINAGSILVKKEDVVEVLAAIKTWTAVHG